MRVRYNVTAERSWKARHEFTNASPKDEHGVRDKRVGPNGCEGMQEVKKKKGIPHFSLQWSADIHI